VTGVQTCALPICRDRVKCLSHVANIVRLSVLPSDKEHPDAELGEGCVSPWNVCLCLQWLLTRTDCLQKSTLSGCLVNFLYIIVFYFVCFFIFTPFSTKFVGCKLFLKPARRRNLWVQELLGLWDINFSGYYPGLNMKGTEYKFFFSLYAFSIYSTCFDSINGWIND
jgi:hypothetical protein